MKKMIHYKYNEKGFSLIEMMVVVVILGLIVLGLVTFFTGGTKSWVAGQYQLAAQRNARQAVDRMVREIREGKSITSDSNATKIKVNYLASFGKDPVTYQLNGTTLERKANLIPNPVIDHVQNIEFKYLDSNNISTAPENASKVHIELLVDMDEDGNPDITLNTDVNLRNFGL